jgi:hypothetical protein
MLIRQNVWRTALFHRLAPCSRTQSGLLKPLLNSSLMVNGGVLQLLFTPEGHKVLTKDFKIVAEIYLYLLFVVLREIGTCIYWVETLAEHIFDRLKFRTKIL